MCTTCHGKQAILVEHQLQPCPECLPERWRAMNRPAWRRSDEAADAPCETTATIAALAG